MRTSIYSACFGFALAVSAFSLGSAPASAVEGPAVTVTAPNNIIKVDDRDERREHREREEREANKHREHCEHARHECRERHHDHERQFHECLEREHCER
jgi:hypothetical protein